MAFWVLLFLLIGCVGGLCAGLFGIGGGVVMVPCLYLTFTWMGIPEQYVMHTAIATSLGSMIFGTGASAISHLRRRNVSLHHVGWSVIGIIFGAIVGPQIAKMLPTNDLIYLFGVLEMVIAVYIAFKRDRLSATHELKSVRIVPLISGFLIAIISSMIGTGGGAFLVPLFLALNFPTNQAIGTSAACGFILTLCATGGYFFSMPNNLNLPYSEGFINIPAWIAISLTCLITAPIGAYLTKHLPSQSLKRLFAGLLFLVGLSMVIF